MKKFSILAGITAFAFLITHPGAIANIQPVDQSVVVNGSTFIPFITQEQIQQRVKELGAELNTKFAGRMPLFVGVLKGSVIFMADLVREFNSDCEMEFMRISSYGDGMSSSGEVKLKEGLAKPVTGRDVILVEDIIDSGRSIKFLKEYIMQQNPKSLTIVALLKREAIAVETSIDYVGFHIPGEFVIGYGLDYAQKGRNLPLLYKKA